MAGSSKKAKEAAADRESVSGDGTGNPIEDVSEPAGQALRKSTRSNLGKGGALEQLDKAVAKIFEEPKKRRLGSMEPIDEVAYANLVSIQRLKLLRLF